MSTKFRVKTGLEAHHSMGCFAASQSGWRGHAPNGTRKRKDVYATTDIK